MKHYFDELLREAEKTEQLAAELLEAAEENSCLRYDAGTVQRLYERARQYANLIVTAASVYEEADRKIRDALSMETIIYPPTVFGESSFAQLRKYEKLIRFGK